MADCVCNTGYTGTSTSCEACHTHSNSQGDATDCTCNKGYGYVFADGVGESCVQCVAGTYKDTQENQACSECNPNEFSSALGADTNTCKPCPANSNSLQQSTSQSDCLCNQGYSKGTNNDETCTECVPGKYKYSPVWGADAADVCQTCPSNTVSPAGSNDQTDCKCQAGWTESAGSCVQCGAGKYKSAAGDAGCKDCSMLSDSAAAGLMCTCNAGATGPVGGPCAYCAPGTYRTADTLNFAHACGPAADAGCPAQHSDYGDYDPAALAVDGDTSADTYSRTAGGYDKSWWRVDLQQEISINTLSITGRVLLARVAC